MVYGLFQLFSVDEDQPLRRHGVTALPHDWSSSPPYRRSAVVCEKGHLFPFFGSALVSGGVMSNACSALENTKYVSMLQSVTIQYFSFGKGFHSVYTSQYVCVLVDAASENVGLFCHPNEQQWRLCERETHRCRAHAMICEREAHRCRAHTMLFFSSTLSVQGFRQKLWR